MSTLGYAPCNEPMCVQRSHLLCVQCMQLLVIRGAVRITSRIGAVMYALRALVHRSWGRCKYHAYGHARGREGLEGHSQCCRGWYSPVGFIGPAEDICNAEAAAGVAVAGAGAPAAVSRPPVTVSRPAATAQGIRGPLF